jgi:hypothetical protein
VGSRPWLEILEDRLVPGSFFSLAAAAPPVLLALHQPQAVAGATGSDTRQAAVAQPAPASTPTASAAGTRAPAAGAIRHPASTDPGFPAGPRLDPATAGGLLADPLGDPQLDPATAGGALADPLGGSTGETGSAGVASGAGGAGVSGAACAAAAPAGQGGSASAPAAPGPVAGAGADHAAAIPAMASPFASQPSPQVMHPTAHLTVSQATVRTPGQISSGPIVAPARPARWEQMINQPTMGWSAYLAAKAAADSAATQAKPGTGAPVITPFTAPISKHVSIAGANMNEAGGYGSPDDDGAVGKTQFLEVTTDHIDVYKKGGTHTRFLNESLESFFGESTDVLWEPRAMYDSTWNRFIVTANARFFESDQVTQHFFIGISQTGSATGSWWIYNITTNGFDGNNFYDYPQLGLDQDAVLFTANILGGNVGTTILGATEFSVAKARLYNGLGWSVGVFVGLNATLAPPNVLDQSSTDYLVANNIGTGTAQVYALVDSSTPASTTLSNLGTVEVDNNSVPPPAAQPGTSEVLDTGDGRFQNASTQIGTSLWQVFTSTVYGTSAAFPVPKFVEIDTSSLTLKQSGTFDVSLTSYDFNPSIVANASDDAFVTWSATDPANGLNTMVRYGGRLHTDVLNTMTVSSTPLITSGSSAAGGGGPLPLQWGRYSAVTVDPSDSTGHTAWIVNEDILDPPFTWGTEIGKIGF